MFNDREKAHFLWGFIAFIWLIPQEKIQRSILNLLRIFLSKKILLILSLMSLYFASMLYLLYLARRKGFKILSVPVYFKKRICGEAKGGAGDFRTRWKLIKRSWSYIFQLGAKARRTSKE